MEEKEKQLLKLMLRTLEMLLHRFERQHRDSQKAYPPDVQIRDP